MSNRLDVSKLIAEVRKRPILWDTKWVHHRVRGSLNTPWHEVAQILGIRVEQCRRKWKNLRDAYRAEIRRVAIRKERSRLLGDYDPNANYKSKLLYFKPMSFIDQNKRRRLDVTENSQDYDAATISSLDNNDQLHLELIDIKSEPIAMAFDIDNDTDNDNDNDNNNGNNNDTNADNTLINDDIVDDIEKTNDELFKQFQSMATPQAARRLSATLNIGVNHIENKQNYRHSYTTTNKTPLLGETNSTCSNSSSRVNLNDNANTDSVNKGLRSRPCKCNAEQKEQINFLENLEREERKLINSTRQDICRAQEINHTGDGDYNFLVSFLPQMKKMTEYQNLKFRAQMCDLVLTIMTPSTTFSSTGPTTYTPTSVHHLDHSINCNASTPVITNSVTTNNTPAICSSK